MARRLGVLDRLLQVFLIVIGNSTPSRATVWTRALLRIWILSSKMSSSAACCGPRNALRDLSCLRHLALAARATAALPSARAFVASTNRSAYVSLLQSNFLRLSSWLAVSWASRAVEL